MKTILFKYSLLAGVAAFLTAAPFAAVHADDNKEYFVKAAFIYNFVKFVEWPDGMAINKTGKADICVLGSGAMMGTSSIFQKASTSKLALTLIEEKSAQSAAQHCHVLFIDASEAGNLGGILGVLKNHPVLTVSDIDGFTDSGGMIGFVVADNKIKIVVNLKAAAGANLRIDAQLLEIALKVIR